MGYLTFKGKSYYAIFAVSGRKIWKKIGRVDKREAKRILKQLSLEFEKDRLNIREIKYITLFDYIERYLEYCLANKATSTYRREAVVMKPQKEFFGNIPITRIDTQMIESYKVKRVKEGNNGE
ncbi:MAG: hypothetical protein C4291_11825 [Candidatus Dadabacteria bacterium]